MTEKLENPTVEAEQPSVDPRHAAEVRAVINALAKFIHGKKIYAENNPNLIKFAKEYGRYERIVPEWIGYKF